MPTKIICLSVSIIMLCSCATSRRTEGLDVSIAGIHFGQSTLWETTVEVTIRIANETVQPLVLEGGVHKIYLNGLYIGSGLSNETIEVPRLSSITQTVTTHLQNLRMITRLRGIIDSQRADYRIVSTIYLQENGRSITYRLTRDGVVDLREFQPSPSATPPRLNQP